MLCSMISTVIVEAAAQLYGDVGRWVDLGSPLGSGRKYNIEIEEPAQDPETGVGEGCGMNKLELSASNHTR